MPDQSYLKCGLATTWSFMSVVCLMRESIPLLYVLCPKLKRNQIMLSKQEMIMNHVCLGVSRVCLGGFS